MPHRPAPPRAPAAAEAPQRVAKLLARAGVASRRDIERMIADGRVALNGTALTTPATLLDTLDGITVDGQPVTAPEAARLFVYHKPAGLLVTARDPRGRPTIYDRLPQELPRVLPVGRLDLSTEGLLLLTTDGGLKRLLELPATGVERTYRARAYGTIGQPALEALIDGIEIEGVRYGPIDANLERRTGANVWIELTLTEGKNREVRRVLEHLGLKVGRLIRTRYGPFGLGDLAPGEVVEVRSDAVERFRRDPRVKELPQPRRRAVPVATATPSAAAASAAPKTSADAAAPKSNRRKPPAAPRVRADGSIAARSNPTRAARAGAFRKTQPPGSRDEAPAADRPARRDRPSRGKRPPPRRR